MNAERVQEVVLRIGDGPEAIAKLRRVAVGLAITGKLGFDNGEADLPALATAMGEGSKAKKHLVRVTASELPNGCGSIERFVPLGTVARIEKGRTGIQGAAQGEFPLVVTAEQRLTCDHFDFDGRAAIVPLVSSAGHGKASIQRLHYQEGKFALGTILAAIFPLHPDLLSPRFLFEYLSAFKEELLVRRMIGTANVTLTIGKLAEVPVPIVRPAAQESLDRLMALCDELDAARTRREKVRDRLSAASLTGLNKPDPKAFQANARFVLNALDALTARTDQIKQLRKSILNLAVQGKLVPQDPNDAPASNLMTAVTDEIADYSRANRAPLNRVVPLADADVPFPVPPGWTWARLASLFRVITDGDHQPPPQSKEGVAFLTIGNITTGQLDFAGCRLVPEGYYRSLPVYRTPERGDILYTVVGATYGRPALVETDRSFCVQRHIAILKPATAINLRFLVALMASPLIYDQASQSTTGAAQPTIALRPLRNFVAPLPPLAEQHRIVAKLDELMAICDQLEAGLIAADATRGRLLDALLAEALSEPNIVEAA